MANLVLRFHDGREKRLNRVREVHFTLGYMVVSFFGLAQAPERLKTNELAQMDIEREQSDGGEVSGQPDRDL